MRRPDPLANRVSQSTPGNGHGPAVAVGPGRPSDASDRGEGDWLDPLTGLDGRLAWERLMRDETARLDRYGRPAAVVVAELDGLTRLTERFGPEPEARILRAVGDALRKQARATDHVARVDEATFYVLLPEQDEITAINYVERVRAICDRWLESGAVSLRLSLGWASPTAGGDLGTALRVAQERLNVERRQATPVAEAAAT
jgi:diguanylate cyclase (GGDEF)-like protein